MSESEILIKKVRDPIIDILKGVGIILMVAGHCGFPFTRFIYLFHMAIFFMASGYCWNTKNSKTIKSVIAFCKRKLASLWFPYVIWTSIFSLLHNWFIRVNVYTDNVLLLTETGGALTQYWTWKEVAINIVKSFLLSGGTQMGGAMWFIAILMKISILYCILDYFMGCLTKSELAKFFVQSIVSILFLFIGCFFHKRNIAFLSMDKVLSYYVLFHLGFVIKHFLSTLTTGKNGFHVLIGIISFFLLLIFNRIGFIALDKTSYENPLFFLIVSVSGWFFIYELSYFLGKTEIIKRLFVAFGQNTLAIVILHFLCFKIVSYIGCCINGVPLYLVATFPVLYTDGQWWILYSLAGLFIPLFVSLLYKSIKNKAKEKILSIDGK